MRSRLTWVIGAAGTLAVCAVLGLSGREAQAYPEYSNNGDGGAGCNRCHGSFAFDSPYVSLTDGQSWGRALMDIHNTMLSGECSTCHTGPTFSPVRLGSSDGGTGLPAISCAGCHGRAADGSGAGSEGYGAGLRQHHWRADDRHPGLDLKVCVDCHTDADPANMTPAGENFLPPYYGAANFSNMPFDPCNPGPDFNEDFAGSTLGLDNDGDDSYDGMDTDCGAQVGTPGEATLLTVTAHDMLAGRITISYAPACEAADNTIEVGPLAQVSSYAYSSQECFIGDTGSYDWTYPPGESLFFLVVANDTTVEGPYGVDSGGGERPEDTTNLTCALPRDLTNRCD